MATADPMSHKGRSVNLTPSNVAYRPRDWFDGRPSRPDIVRFVSVLSRAPHMTPPLPLILPSSGQWLVRVLARDGRCVIGEYRRQLKAIGYLGALDRVFGAPATTRNWNTITAIAKALEAS